MGCGGSKRTGKQWVDMKMEPTGNDDIDDMFNDFIVPLQTLAGISNDIFNAEWKLKRVTETYLLKDATLEDSVIAMLYAFISCVDGNIQQLGLSIEFEAPYIKFNKEKINADFLEVFEVWKFLVDVISDAVKKIEELPGQIEELPGKCENLPDQAKEAISSLGLDPFTTIKILKIILNNVAKIVKAPFIMAKTIGTFKRVLEMLKNLPKKFNEEGRKEIVSVAKEIFKFKPKTMRDIVVNFWADKTRINLKLEKPRKEVAKRKPLGITKIGPPPVKKGMGIVKREVKKEENVDNNEAGDAEEDAGGDAGNAGNEDNE